MNLIIKSAKSKLQDSYFNVQCDGKPVTFDMESGELDTARGMYSQFIIPSDKCVGNLSSKSRAYLELEGADQHVPAYEDVLISKSSNLYSRLCAFRSKLVHDIANAIQDECKRDQTSALAAYVDKYCSDTGIADEINIMFIKSETCSNAYIHMKISRNTQSYCKGALVDNVYLMYKRFLTVPCVQVDNIRIPKTRNASNKLNVHLVIVKQHVSEYVRQ